jgi:DNA-binding response OmpR family regulator
LSEIKTPKKILVIDDEADMLHLLERILTEEGYQVRLANDGIYGLSLVTDDKPDLILLDIMMPGPDGITVLKKIREQTSVPVIMITGKRDTDTIKESIDFGADDYVRKPFRPSELLARIKSKLRRA